MAVKMADAAVYTVITIKTVKEISTPILTVCTKRYHSSISRRLSQSASVVSKMPKWRLSNRK